MDICRQNSQTSLGRPEVIRWLSSFIPDIVKKETNQNINGVYFKF